MTVFGFQFSVFCKRAGVRVLRMGEFKILYNLKEAFLIHEGKNRNQTENEKTENRKPKTGF